MYLRGILAAVLLSLACACAAERDTAGLQRSGPASLPAMEGLDDLAARRVSIGDTQVFGDEPLFADPSAVADSGLHTLSIGGPGYGGWAIYAFAQPAPLHFLDGVTVRLDAAALPGRIYVGFADYTKGQWNIVAVDSPEPIQEVAAPRFTDLYSPSGISYVAVLAHDTTAVVRRLTLEAQETGWARSLGAAESDSVRDMAADSDGNLYILSQRTPAGNDPTCGDMLIHKRAADGTLQWARGYRLRREDTTETGDAQGRALLLTTGDELALIGDTEDGQRKLFFAPIMASGGTRQARLLAREGGVWCAAGARDSDELVLVGDTIGPGGSHITRLSFDGEVNLSRIISDESMPVHLMDVAAAPDGETIAVGRAGMPTNGLALRINAFGTLRWQRYWSQPSQTCTLGSLTVDGAGATVCCGTFTPSAPGQTLRRTILLAIGPFGTLTSSSVWQNTMLSTGPRVIGLEGGGFLLSTAILKDADYSIPAYSALLQLDGQLAAGRQLTWDNPGWDAFSDLLQTAQGDIVFGGSASAAGDAAGLLTNFKPSDFPLGPLEGTFADEPALDDTLSNWNSETADLVYDDYTAVEDSGGGTDDALVVQFPAADLE